jgi:putative oxidoreductase
VALHHLSPDDLDAVSLGIAVLPDGAVVTPRAHGCYHYVGGGKIAGTARWFDSMGMRPGKAHAILASCTELGAGSLIALGLFTPLACAACVALMIVASYTVHLKNGFFSVRNGWEYTGILALVGVAIATIGPWKYSLDYAFDLAFRFNGLTGLAIALIVGIGGALLQLGLFYRPPAED